MDSYNILESNVRFKENIMGEDETCSTPECVPVLIELPRRMITVHTSIVKDTQYLSVCLLPWFTFNLLAYISKYLNSFDNPSEYEF